MDTLTLQQLMVIAQRILDDAEKIFRENLGAKPEIQKSPGDYTTKADLVLERYITKALVERTGFGVHGEEYGGADLASVEPIWVVDPIDGTANFMHQLPMTGINVALLIAREPQIGLTWLPMVNEKYWALKNEPVYRNSVRLPPLERTSLAASTVLLGNINYVKNSPFSHAYRLASLSALAQRAFRLRILGSSALELAWVAGGRCGAAVNFGGQIWDNAPGLCLVQAAGGVVNNIEGEPYRLTDSGIVASAPGVAEELTELFADLRL